MMAGDEIEIDTTENNNHSGVSASLSSASSPSSGGLQSPLSSPESNGYDFFQPDDFDDFDLDYNGSFMHLLQGFGDSYAQMKTTSDKLKRDFNAKKNEFKDSLKGKQEEFNRKLKGRRRELKRKLRKQKNVKLRDKFVFVGGVSTLWFVPFVISFVPQYLPYYYLIITFVSISLRFLMYKSKGWHYFTADLCYVVNFLTLLTLFVFPSFKLLFVATFGLANGPLPWAIYAWRNSMVFHSVDKMTSVWIHYMPPLVLFILRWSEMSSDLPFSYVKKLDFSTMDYGIKEFMICSLVMYSIWQGSYYYFIMVRKAEKIYNGQRATSFTWMLADYMKNRPDNKLTKLMLYVGPKYHALTFMSLNFAYAIVTLIPTFLLYKYFYLHATFMVLILTMSIFNGADYYIEVFSNRYRQELGRLDSLDIDETFLEATFGETGRGKGNASENPAEGTKVSDLRPLTASQVFEAKGKKSQ